MLVVLLKMVNGYVLFIGDWTIRSNSAWSKPSGFKPPSGDGGTEGGAPRGTADPDCPFQPIEPLNSLRNPCLVPPALQCPRSV